MSDPAELDLDLTDPWTVWGLEMGRLMRAAGIPPDQDILQSVARLARLRQEVEAKEARLAGLVHPGAISVAVGRRAPRRPSDLAQVIRLP